MYRSTTCSECNVQTQRTAKKLSVKKAVSYRYFMQMMWDALTKGNAHRIRKRESVADTRELTRKNRKNRLQELGNETVAKSTRRCRYRRSVMTAMEHPRHVSNTRKH